MGAGGLVTDLKTEPLQPEPNSNRPESGQEVQSEDTGREANPNGDKVELGEGDDLNPGEEEGDGPDSELVELDLGRERGYPCC